MQDERCIVCWLKYIFVTLFFRLMRCNFFLPPTSRFYPLSFQSPSSNPLSPIAFEIYFFHVKSDATIFLLPHLLLFSYAFRPSFLVLIAWLYYCNALLSRAFVLEQITFICLHTWFKDFTCQFYFQILHNFNLYLVTLEWHHLIEIMHVCACALVCVYMCVCEG